jgi:putative transposase
MPRIARIVVPGLPHHVMQRGNNLQNVFFTDRDRIRYLEILKQQSQRFGLRVIAYCLMSNHVHLIAVPQRADSLAKAVGRTHWIYTQYINRLRGRRGHLWQNRYFSCALDGEHEERGVRYIERNPIRARVARLPWKYRWSSAAAHCGFTDDEFELLHDLRGWRARYPRHAWRRIVQEVDDDAFALRWRKRTHNGRPLGSDRFIARLEAKLNRSLRDPKLGRPRTTSKANANAKPARTRAKRRLRASHKRAK